MGSPHGFAEIVLNQTPPSFNKLGTRGSHWAVNSAKKQWQRSIEQMLMVAGAEFPRDLARVTASAVMRFPKRRGRDINNYVVILDKALGDALKNGRWIVDDTPEFYTFAGLSFDPDLGPDRTTIVLEYELRREPDELAA